MSLIQFSQFESRPERLPDQVGSEGPKTARLAFIGEAPAKQEVREGRPFAGDAGRVFDHCLHDAQIIRASSYVTNFIKVQVGKDIAKFVGKTGKHLTSDGIYWRDSLAEELNDVQADILVTLGGPATLAVTGHSSISKIRGYLTQGTGHFGERPVIPTLHPASCLYGGNYINKYYIAHDFRKAARLLLPEGGIMAHDVAAVRFPSTVGEVERMVQEMRDAGIFAFDIEVANYEVSCISFAASKELSYSVLLCQEGMWSEHEELRIWELLESILSDPNLVKVGQNLIFDTHFLISHQNVFVRGPIVDTMIGHHLIYPDFLKGLGFLASIYTNVPDWKDMVKFKGGNIKKES